MSSESEKSLAKQLEDYLALELAQLERSFRKATEALLANYNFTVTDVFMDRLITELPTATVDRDSTDILQEVCAEFGLRIETRKDQTRN
jgi:hypothetical protein